MRRRLPRARWGVNDSRIGSVRYSARSLSNKLRARQITVFRSFLRTKSFRGEYLILGIQIQKRLDRRLGTVGTDGSDIDHSTFLQSILGNPDSGMIEGRALEFYSFVGQGNQKANQLIFLSGIQADGVDSGIQIITIESAKITPAIVELNDLPQGRRTAVMKVGSGQFTIAQARSLECTIDRHAPEVLVDRFIFLVKAVGVLIIADRSLTPFIHGWQVIVPDDREIDCCKVQPVEQGLARKTSG